MSQIPVYVIDHVPGDLETQLGNFTDTTQLDGKVSARRTQKNLALCPFRSRPRRHCLSGFPKSCYTDNVCPPIPTLIPFKSI